MILITPRLDLDGERWFSPMEGLRLLVSSSENSRFRSRNALIRRHIDKLDDTFKLGTEAFELEKIGDVDALDEMLIDNCVRYLLKGWEGVGEVVDGKEVAIEYTPEGGKALLLKHPELYWQILGEASDIAQGKEQQTQEAVKKPSKRKAG